MKPDAPRTVRYVVERVAVSTTRCGCSVNGWKTARCSRRWISRTPAGGQWGVTLNWTNAANPSDHHVPNTSDDAVVNLPGNVTVVYQGKQPTVQSLENDDTIWVQGANAGGDAVLTASAGIKNVGTIHLESVNNTYQSNIATGSSTLTNLGTISAGAGSGGNRIISGTLDNQAAVDATGDYIDITGDYKADGGTITSTGYLINCTLQETAAGAGVDHHCGGPRRHTGNGQLGRLYDLGAGRRPRRRCDPQARRECEQLRLDSAPVSQQYLQIRHQHRLERPDEPGHNQLGRRLGRRTAHHRHDRQQGHHRRRHADYLDITGTYKADGGTIIGSGYLVNCTLQETAAPASASTITAAGQGVTLATDNLAGYTLWVRGGNHGGDAVLQLAGDRATTATILLQSADNTYQSDIATGSSTLTNLGTISSGRLGRRTDHQRHARQQGHDRRRHRLPGDHGHLQGGRRDDHRLWLPGQLHAAGDRLAGLRLDHHGHGHQGVTLATDNLAGYTLWVRGGNHGGDAILQARRQRATAATILLQSANSNYQSDIATGS